MGNANTHERRKSGVPETGLIIEDIRSPPALTIGEEDGEEGRGGAGGQEKTPPPGFDTSVTGGKTSPAADALVLGGSGGSPPYTSKFRPPGTSVEEAQSASSSPSSGQVDPADADKTGGGQRGLPTIFKFSGNAKEAYVCGTFSEWKKIPMVKSQKDFVALIDLPVGEHHYKFFVDDAWTHDANLPTVRNELGSRNNVIKIQQDDFDAFTALDMDSRSTNLRHRRGPEGEFGQEVPGVHSFENKPGPPILPPHLLQVILNKDTPLSCEPTLLPEPNHVMINHLYALSIKDGVMVISSTQRYRKKYVTTLLYKPIEGAA